MIEDPIIMFALGNITGSTFMMATWMWYLKRQKKKAQNQMDEMMEELSGAFEDGE